MNLCQLKYIIEIEKVRSITQAANNLFMGQSNLSRSLRDLEINLGFRIFVRDPKGLYPTPEGQKVLASAKKVVAEVDKMEGIGKYQDHSRQKFSLSVPRASYISYAFTNFVESLDPSVSIEFDYTETNAMGAVDNIVSKNYNLGIIRFRTTHEDAFLTLLQSKELSCRLISEFKYDVLLSERHPLAAKEKLTMSDLESYIELVYGDPYVPNLGSSKSRQSDIQDKGNSRISLYERGGQFDLLCGVPRTYMWTSPVPSALLHRHRLVVRECGNAGDELIHKDMLIYRKGHEMTELEDTFLEELFRTYKHIFRGNDKAS